MKIFFVLSLLSLNMLPTKAQTKTLQWQNQDKCFYQLTDSGITQTLLPSLKATTIVGFEALNTLNQHHPIVVDEFRVSDDESTILLFANTQKVWRYRTKGDYFLYNVRKRSLFQLGKGLDSASLMFAKLSPKGNLVAYVSNHNLYVENLETHRIQPLTTDGTDNLINGTFDWAYEEEFGCKDGFRWSPDGSHIAFWKIDARSIRHFLLINNTDSVYSFTKPVEYPIVGWPPSACFVYTVNVNDGVIQKMDIPGDAQQHYIPRMEWANNSNELVVQQLNRLQNKSILSYCNATTGQSRSFYIESDSAWIDVKVGLPKEEPGWEWINKGQSFLWVSEKDGWRHIYNVDRNGRSETLVTKGAYDIISLVGYNEKEGLVYFTASPTNATQAYLYSTRLNGKTEPQRLTPIEYSGTNGYEMSPSAQYALHAYTNTTHPFEQNLIDLPTHKRIEQIQEPSFHSAVGKLQFFQIKTQDGITMDGWVSYPTHFDSTKKYPLLFYVYSEPGAATVTDTYGLGRSIYKGSLANDGYLYVSVDGRGTPAPKGAAWRKSIYKKVGILNVHDQAAAAQEILKWKFVDTNRVAVWGWSGGGSTTLNLLFQYPNIYKTGIAVAPVTTRLRYDNIYEERYMGLPQQNHDDYVKASALSYAKNLQGHLLLIHGTGDDNVHYQNTELLINELVKYNKQFDLMSYPNRTHSLREGEGTGTHLSTLFTQFLNKNCPPGAR